jgi:hypothetical protein
MLAEDMIELQIETTVNKIIELITHLIKKKGFTDTSFYPKGYMWQNPDTYIWKALSSRFQELGYKMEFIEDCSTIDNEYIPKKSGPVTKISW